MARTVTDSRQIILRSFLTQLASISGYAGTSDAKPANSTELDNLLASIDSELTPPLRMSASSTPDLVISVGAANITNSEQNRSHIAGLVGKTLSAISSATITFPAASGGTITVTSGNNATLTVTSNNYLKFTVYIDLSGNLNVLPGAENTVEASATVVPAPANTLVLGYITIFNNAGTIDNITQSKIFQFPQGAKGTDAELSPLRMYANNPANSKLNIAPYEIQRVDGTGGSIPAVKSTILNFPASTIDFQTGATTGGTFAMTFPTTTVGNYRRIGLTLLVSNTIQALFSPEAATLGALANPGTLFVNGGIPIGWVDLQATGATAFKTADSATSIVENSVSGSSRIHLIASGGGGSSGTGSGVGDDLGSLTFKASMVDTLDDLSTDANTTIDYSANKTDSSLLSIANQYIRISYDAGRTVAGGTTTTNLNLDAVVSGFTAKIGDFAIYGSEIRRITAVASQSSFTTEAFSVAPTVAGQVTISQGVYTKDLNAHAADGLAPSTAFSTSINQVLTTYEETTSLNDIIFDANSAPSIAYSASSDGTSYSSLAVRPTNIVDLMSILNLPTSGTNLYLRFVANKTSGAGSVNLLSYKIFFHRDTVYSDGTVLNQAYCFTDGVGTEINCSTPTVVTGKTRLQVGFNFPVDVNSGKTNGSIKVYLNGQKIPRFVDSVITPDASYKEISTNTIELDGDYSALNYSLEVVQDVAVIDNIDVNTSNITYLQEVQQKGFQGFVDETSLLTPTTVTGTPAAGSFYSSIQNRASIPNISADLKARMGVERIMTQSIARLQNEFGPSGQPVSGAVNDDKGLIRFVGDWAANINSSGQYVLAGTSTQDYAEIVFYGTGLNILGVQNGGTDLRVTIDGGSEGANIYQTVTALAGRNYTANHIFNAASNLALGVHTAKIRSVGGVGQAGVIAGFEVLNESSTIKLNPGTSYVNGKKLVLNSQQSLAYNSSFESGTLGTKGGRVLVYQKADGSIAKAVQPAEASIAYLTSANHANEEIARPYHWREFGAGRSDDYSLLTSTASSRAFTLDDGTTTLVGLNNRVVGSEGLSPFSTNDHITFTFVGTGLDIVSLLSSAMDSHAVTVDGVSAGNITTQTIGQMKIVSGLPYGMHTVKILRSNNVTGAMAISHFVVYQPKKPTLPSGAIELADYNVMATYAASTTEDMTNTTPPSTGTLYKSPMREQVYVGTWSVSALNHSIRSGFYVQTSTSGDYVEYVFFGTGIIAYSIFSATPNNRTVQIDGVAYTGAATVGYNGGSVPTWTPGSSTWLDGGAGGSSLQITGLSLGLHKIRITKSTATDIFGCGGFTVITPAHSTKSNIYADLQNTLPVGSCAISDNRKISAIKESLPQIKAWAQAVGVTSGPSTTSTSFIPLADMSCVIRVNGTSNRIKISYNIDTLNSSPATNSFIIVLNGLQVGQRKDIANPAGSDGNVSDSFMVPVGPGIHKVDIYWATNAGTMSGRTTQRNLLVEEL